MTELAASLGANYEPPLLIEQHGDHFEIRLRHAPAITDPHVSVRCYDAPDVGHPYTSLKTRGVTVYDDDRRNGTVRSGSPAAIAVKTELLDTERKASAALDIAALAFKIANY